MKGLWKFLFGLLCGLLVTGVILLIARQPRAHPVNLLPPPTAGPIAVHVTGAVKLPGVYTLAPGSRAQDAIRAAGGLAEQADPASLNLAIPLKDGQQVVVGSLQPTATAPLRQSAPATAPGASKPAVTARQPLIHINTATIAELETLPYIGPSLAQAILSYRELHGPFKDINELLKVPGIGPKTFEKIKDLIAL